jgi:hypothetical protein
MNKEENNNKNDKNKEQKEKQVEVLVLCGYSLDLVQHGHKKQVH